MRSRTLVIPICAAVALLLCACRTSGTDPIPVRSVSLAQLDTVRHGLDALVGSGAVGAIATLTENGATTVVTAGHADRAAGTPIPTDVPQHVRAGSVTKSFTAVIVLQLVAENRIDLDRPIDTYLPGLLTGAGVDGRVITVRQILGHRSGLPAPPESLAPNEYVAARDGHTYTPAQEIALALRSPAQFALGTRFRYSNTNYLVAGMLIEAVTGHRYADELGERILAPLGLSDTYLPATGEIGLREPHPAGYATVDGIVTDTTITEPSLPWASGALVSTGADLNRFFTALSAGEVVSRDLFGQMLDGSDMGAGDGMSYGLGIGYTRLPCGVEFVGNIGGVRGFSTISGATSAGRAVTISYTGTPATVNIGDLLTHGLCG